ncbi:alpha/beta hydrolase [Niastella caeni]|uniref:Alpha/beta hydrolase n=1 Tax=Niastella caeni TaxID=2569763 RepID=A0A4S8HHY8_9BACT|nr:alpha/beta hydrolase [Niastella caeni]THU34131.1 alpha/beta hydrolase [Niastella caeni]
MHGKAASLFVAYVLSTFVMQAQDFIPLWPAGKMPNTKGMRLKDSIYNERVYQVGTPGMYTFFPSVQENKQCAVIICPGGGYHHLSYQISGFQLAKWFNTMGISAFVLNYRLPNAPDLAQREIGPLQDAQRAIRVIRANADRWKIQKDKIGVMGVSAGGHLAASLGNSTDDVAAIGDSLNTISFRPDFTILVSPVITMGQYTHKGSRENLLGNNPSKELVEKYSMELQVKSATPPCFIADAFNDKGVDPRNSLLFYHALLEKNISTSFHVFPQGGHNIALRNNPGSAQLWTSLCEMWLTEMGFLK